MAANEKNSTNHLHLFTTYFPKANLPIRMPGSKNKGNEAKEGGKEVEMHRQDCFLLFFNLRLSHRQGNTTFCFGCLFK